MSPFSFSLSNGDNATGNSPLSHSVSPVSNTTYTATITDNRGCIADITGNPQTVSVNPIPSTPTTVNPSAVCFGTAVTVEGTGSTQTQGSITGYTFWDAEVGGSQLANSNVLGTISGDVLTTSTALVAGTYDVYIQAEGVPSSCPSSRKKVTITILPLPTITSIAQSAAICDAGNAAFNLTGLPASSNIAVSYSINTTPTATTGTANVTSNSSGEASFTLNSLSSANFNGKTISVTSLTNNSQAPACTTTISSVSSSLTVHALPSVTATGGAFNRNQTPTITATSGFLSYVWSGTPSVTGTGNSVTISPTPAAGAYSYSVLVTDANTCQNTANATVIIYDAALYVNSTTGSNSNPGTLASPLATIQKAVDVAVAGDEISVAAGTYTENVTVNKAVTLKGANFGTAGCATRTSESTVAGGVGTAFNITASGVTIDGFEITGVTGVASTSATNVAVRNNKMTVGAVGVNAAAIATSTGNTLTVEDNCIALTTQVAGSNPTIGVFINGATGSESITIDDNTTTNGFYGYVLNGVNTTAASIVSDGIVTGVMQGVAVVNTVGGPLAKSNVFHYRNEYECFLWCLSYTVCTKLPCGYLYLYRTNDNFGTRHNLERSKLYNRWYSNCYSSEWWHLSC